MVVFHKNEVMGSILSENIRRLRRELNYSQEQLSERSGVPRSTIASLERGEGNPTLQVLIGISHGLGVAIAQLLAQRTPRANLYAKDAQSLVSYARTCSDSEGEAGIAQLLRLTPEQARYLVIEEVILEGKEKICSEPHAMGTEEYFFLVEGSCVVEVAQNSFEVAKGDLLRFDGDQPHAYCGLGVGQRARGFAVVVQIPRV